MTTDLTVKIPVNDLEEIGNLLGKIPGDAALRVLHALAIVRVHGYVTIKAGDANS